MVGCDQITGWADEKTDLDLVVKVTGTDVTFTDAWFIFDDLDIIETANLWGVDYGRTNAGQINFYADGTATNPLLTLTFTESFVSQQGFGAKDFFAQNVNITGSAIPNPLWQEEFSFSFTNVSTFTDGFTSTASFTSAAIPEPSTIVLLGLGGFLLIETRRRFSH